jgi:outer membrane protein assembly factor BamB
MTLPGDRQQDGTRRAGGRRWQVAALAVFGLIFVLLVVYQIFFKGTAYSDDDRLKALQGKSLEQVEVKIVDWPQWRGPARTGISAETGFLRQWPAQGPPVLWEQPAGTGYSAPVVADNRLYLIMQDGDHEAVICRDAGSGKELWRFRYPARYNNSYGNGPRSTASVDGPFLYTVGGTGILHCLKTHPATATGEMVWRKDLLEDFSAPNLRWGVSFSPLVDGDRVYTNPGGPGGNSLAAFDKATGRLLWKSLDDPAGYSSPVAVTLAGKRQIVFFTGAGLVGVVPEDGSLLWRFPWETNFGCNIATPIAAGDYVFISSGYGRGCAVVQIEGDGAGFQARRVYENTRMCTHFSSCVLFKDHLFGFDESKLVCMEFRTGTVKWRKLGFGKGSLLIADGLLIILGDNGKLALAEASPEDYREQAAFQGPRRKCWTMPVLAQGRLYVRDQERIICYDLRKK